MQCSTGAVLPGRGDHQPGWYFEFFTAFCVKTQTTVVRFGTIARRLCVCDSSDDWQSLGREAQEQLILSVVDNICGYYSLRMMAPFSPLRSLWGANVSLAHTDLYSMDDVLFSSCVMVPRTAFIY